MLNTKTTSGELKLKEFQSTLNTAAVQNYKGRTALDNQSSGRCCYIPSVINKMIHNVAHGAAFMIHSFSFLHGISALLVCLLWKVAGNAHSLANTQRSIFVVAPLQTTDITWNSLCQQALLLSSNNKVKLYVKSRHRSFLDLKILSDNF